MSRVAYPKTKFIKVKCPSCSNEQITFDSAKMVVTCNVCGAELLKPRGGKAKVLGEIVETYS